ncbi:MAG TPA: hypothetical protein VFZ25_07190 [Chloroflexota bacterium]|nr:hypothetical protein [Chloroflexota bacterium]
MNRLLGLLFARSSFLEGVARIFDFADAHNEYNTSATPEEADYLALLSDWQVVGDDLRSAIAVYGQEIEQSRDLKQFS